MKLSTFLSVLTLVTALSAFADDGETAFKAKDGFVPDAETAKRIAEAVWIPIYGKEVIESEKPFRATLRGDVWIVEGTLKKPSDTNDVVFGGTALAEIAKSDARIIKVIHGK